METTAPTEPMVDIAASTVKPDNRSSISSWKDRQWGRGTKTAEGEEANQDKRRVSTGIPDLDLLVEGGFPAGKSYLITGEQGSGKSIFCIQFILNGLIEGEKAVYVTVDEKPADIIEEAASLGWDLRKFVEEKKLLILDPSPFFSGRAASATRGGGLDVAKTVGDLANYVKRMEASRVVIDPVSPLIGSSDSSSITQEHARTLVHALQDNMGTTNLLTSNSFSSDFVGAKGGEGSSVYGVVVLRFIQKQNSLIRTLLVSKMRRTAIDLNEYSFDIVRKRGIVLRPFISEVPPTPDKPSMPESPTPEIPEVEMTIFKEWGI